MCGVLYFRGEADVHRQLLSNLLQESRVRGLHAFGVATRQNGGPFQVLRSFTIQTAVEWIQHEPFQELIGHTRYDTSGDWKVIGNNQPVVIGSDLLVFNGVVRMSLKEQYEAEFHRQYETANDGEIVLDLFSRGQEQKALSLLKEECVSFAGVIHANGKTFALRNERRPLWIAKLRQSTFVFSTWDIWRRAVLFLDDHRYLNANVEQVPPGEILCL